MQDTNSARKRSMMFVTNVGQRKSSESPTEIEPMASQISVLVKQHHLSCFLLLFLFTYLLFTVCAISCVKLEAGFAREA